jgi:ribose/xylose/arabinose/galactoside ABC-type transport system permease subunit
MSELGRAVLFLGMVLVVIGGAILLLGKAGIPIGRLPGDISYRGKHTTFYFPIVTCIVISVILTLISWLVQHFRR